ncbi:MAG: deoxyguanosinetriphosphate triphosphohydrolase [Hyphomicrobiaceae bacterium]
MPGSRQPAGYAASARPSRGRRHVEVPCPTRTEFQRDRDRVIHATAFRRLTHKTQVFLYHEGDHYRTRLTHSLEVAQIARTVARQLCLDEDLAEAMALAHDLGHPPFGHAGERALDNANAAHGGFDHNAQSLRVVTQLERKYPAFDGLNLTWESLEGLIKHNGPLTKERNAAVLRVIAPLAVWQDFAVSQWPSAEAQVAALADDIAYATHDIDDGLRAGVITIDDLAIAPLADGIVAATSELVRVADASRRHYDVSRRMITLLIGDLVEQTRRNLRALAPSSPDDIRQAGRPVVAFSADVGTRLEGLKRFLFARVYRHQRVMRVMDGAEAIVRDLFQKYSRDAAALPEQWRLAAGRLDDLTRPRLIADFVAGMTDRYAIAEHGRLFDATPELR